MSCSVADCSRSVTRHAMYRTARGLLLPLRPLYLCDDHPLESVRLEGVDT